MMQVSLKLGLELIRSLRCIEVENSLETMLMRGVEGLSYYDKARDPFKGG
jgi:hypothetical protein